MVAEQVDHLPGLADRLLARATCVAPLQRKVLPEQQAGGVRGVVELEPGDVRVDSQQIEVGIDRELHVVEQLGGRRLGERHAGRSVVRAHREHALAVHGHLPVAQADLAKRGAEPPVVARRARDLDPHLDVTLRLVAEPPGPPARWVVDLDGE